MSNDRVDLRGALAELLSTGHLSPAVRPDIARSWLRSAAFDLRPDRLEVPFENRLNPDDRLERAARPVLDRLVDDLDSATIAVLLADAHGTIVERVVGERPPEVHLERAMVAPGSRYDERHVGTNAIGSALAQRAPSTVIGKEHFADALTHMACAAAPIIDPTNASVIGVVDLTCPVEASHTLMLAVAKRAARDIQQLLISADPAADRVLLESFLTARRGARGPLVALNGRTMYTNAPAVKLVDDIDRTLLWDLVSSALNNRQYAQLELPVPPEGSSQVSCKAVTDGTETVGALLRFAPGPTPAIGRSAPERGRSHAMIGWESLTETERSVADLVSEGRTNRQIAAATFLSPHTVGYHLRHIFYKLGVSSRVELTRLVVTRSRDAD